MHHLNFSILASASAAALAAMSLITAAQAQAVTAGPAAAKALLLADQVVVIEDDGARIEETRRRGQVVRVQVQSKLVNARSYDIVLKPSTEPASQQRGAAGRSAWHVFSF